LNGNPSAAQKRFHDELRRMYFETQSHNGIGELHHIWGSKMKCKLLSEAGIDKPGEWLVIMLPKTVHDNIKSYTFEEEREYFMAQQREYFQFYHKESPVPEEVVKYYKMLNSKQQVIRHW